MKPLAELTQERMDEFVKQCEQDGWPREDAEMTAKLTWENREDQFARRIPTRFQGARESDLEGPMADAVAEWKAEPWRNLVLLGAVGVGKTHAAVAAARLAIIEGMTLLFYPVVDLLDELRPSGGDSDVLSRCKNTDVLVLDDLGAERPTDWTAERLYSLVNARWLEQRPVIVTSNLSARNGQGPFVDAVGPRMYSRLVDGAVVAQAAGEDRRRQ